MPTLSDELGMLRSDVNSLKDEVTGTGDAVGLGSQIVGTVRPENRTVVIVQKSIASDTFVLSDSTRNQLDGNYKLVGSGAGEGVSSSVWEQVLNLDNTYEENFDLDTFIDSSSTGTHVDPSGLTGGYFEIESGETLISTLVAIRPSTTYTTVQLTVQGSNTSSLTLSVSGDGGTTYQSVTNGLTTTLTNVSTNGIKYKLENTGGGGTTFPLTFPFTFTGSSTVEVTDVTLRYS